jgi:hypothetical protein
LPIFIVLISSRKSIDKDLAFRTHGQVGDALSEGRKLLSDKLYPGLDIVSNASLSNRIDAMVI